MFTRPERLETSVLGGRGNRHRGFREREGTNRGVPESKFHVSSILPQDISEKNQSDIDEYRADILTGMLTPDDLLLIVAISEEGSLTAAAERLATSQPALSRALSDLERRLGTRLFARLPRGMEPTDATRSLATHGTAIQAVTQRAERQLLAQIAVQSAEIVVGIVPTVSIVPTARALAALHTLEPPLRVDARVGGGSQLITGLRGGELDVVVGPLPDDDADLISTPLFDDRPVLVVRAGHPLLQAGLAHELEALAKYPWVTPPPPDDANRRLRRLFRDAELEPPRPAIVTRDVPLATTIASTSDFVTMLPRDVAMIAAGMAGLTVLPIELPGPPSMIGALQRRDVPNGIELDVFINALRSELATVGMRQEAQEFDGPA